MQLVRHFGPHTEHAKAIPMRKLEGWSVPRNFLPQALNTTIGTTFADVVEEYNAAL